VEKKSIFDMETALSSWEQEILSEGKVRPDELNELKLNLLDSVNGLKNNGLSEEEAFSVGIHRLGKGFDWNKKFGQVNMVLLQAKRLIAFSKGILFYFFSYYSILIISKVFVFFSVQAGNQPAYATHIAWVINEITLITTIFLFFTLFLKESRIYRLLEFVHFKPNHSALILAFTILLGIVDLIFRSVFRSFQREHLVYYSLYEAYKWFSYLYPLTICLGYITLYYKFFRKL